MTVGGGNRTSSTASRPLNVLSRTIPTQRSGRLLEDAASRKKSASKSTFICGRDRRSFLTKADDLPSLSLSLHSHMVHHFHSFGLALFVSASHVTDAQAHLCDTALLEEPIDFLLNFRIDRHVGRFRSDPATGAPIGHSYIICSEPGDQWTSLIGLLAHRNSCPPPALFSRSQRELVIRCLRPLQTLCSGSQLARVYQPLSFLA